MDSYRVTVHADPHHGWSITALDRTVHARRIRDVTPAATAVIAAVENIDPATVSVEINWPAPVADQLSEMHRHTAAAQHATAEVTRLRQLLITQMRARGEKIEDIAVLLGLSRQRVQALAADVPAQPQ